MAHLGGDDDLADGIEARYLTLGLKAEGSCVGFMTHLGEDDDLVDAVGARLGDGLDETVAPAQAVDARHGENGQVLLAVVHEDRQDEVRRRYVRLADRAARGVAAPVAARPGGQVLSDRAAGCQTGGWAPPNSFCVVHGSPGRPRLQLRRRRHRGAPLAAAVCVVHVDSYIVTWGRVGARALQSYVAWRRNAPSFMIDYTTPRPYLDYYLCATTHHPIHGHSRYRVRVRGGRRGRAGAPW